MQATTDTVSVLEDTKVPLRLKLAALWTTNMFVYAYGDIIGFYEPGSVEDILAGRVWEFEITQTWALGALGLMLLPILMVFLSLVLPVRANRMTNIIVAAFNIVLAAANPIGESWIYYWGLLALVEIALLALVIRYAWRWPRTER